ncbi:MAG: NAD(P)H-dependent oxidoreductase, partial [Ginsengibacter sp.]
VVFSLKDIDVLQRDAAFLKIENEILFPTQKFIFIIPEYNGSYPGVLKAMIDTSDISNAWYRKKALLTGVSTGRAGNLRGMDHLADCLHYLKMNVHYNKLPISVIDKVMDTNGRFNDTTLKVIDEQLNEFINF